MSSSPIRTEQEKNEELSRTLYNMIMERLEPDLLMENIASLDEKYAGETSEEHESRIARYEGAYAKFDELLAAFLAETKGQLRGAKREALKSDEAAEKTVEEEAMNTILQNITT